VDALKLDVGPVILIGLMIGAPSAVIGLLAASWLNKTMPIEMRPMAGGTKEVTEFTRLPSLPMALAPVVLPVLLITIATVYSTVTKERKNDEAQTKQVATSDAGAGEDSATAPEEKKDVVKGWLDFVGNPNLAMIIAAIFAIYLCWKVQGHSLPQLAENIEDALLSGGVIILITAAGGAFGALLAMTEIQNVVQGFFTSEDGSSTSSGLAVIFVAYALAAILKVAQGSSTVSMIISSSLVASIALPMIASDTLGFHAAYLVPVIGAGSLMGSWMNDSGFWVFAKMGVLTEKETLRSWTVLLSILSISGFLITLLLVTVLPFPFAQ
jgi:GntP family gluconate:H+ symporter